MKIIDRFMSCFFSRTPKKRSYAKSYIARHARGNVNLQLGRIMTSEDYEARRKKVLSYEFS